MPWNPWSVWPRKTQSSRRVATSRSLGLGDGVETLEVRRLLSTINGVSVSSRFTLNSALASRTNIGFTLTGLAQDSDGDGNVNGRTVVFTGSLGSKIGTDSNGGPQIQALNSSGSVIGAAFVSNSGSVSTFSLTVTLANTSSAQAITFRVVGGPNHTPRRTATVNKVAGGTLTSTLTVKPVTPGIPDLQSASDTGSSSGDNKTNDTTPTFNISGIVVGNTVDLLRDGAVVGTINGATASTVAITSSVTSSGTYSYTARQRENSGGVNGSESQALGSVVIDATPPAAPNTLTLKAASDTGSSNSDRYTSSTALGFTVGNIEAGAFVELLRDNTVVATQINSAAGTITLNALNSLAGTATFSVRQTDVAGNVSTLSSGISVTVDTTPPSLPSVPDLLASSDTGSSNSDNLTTDTTPSFKFSNIEVGAIVKLLRDGAVVATLTSGGGGSATLTDPAVPAGQFNYTAIQTDLAGNSSGTTSSLQVTIVSAAVAAPALPDLLSTKDSGSDNTDNITNFGSLTFSIDGILTRATVDFLRDGVVIASLTSSAGGTVSFNDQLVSAGTYIYTARQTSAAGATSDPSSELAVAFDPLNPTAPDTPDLLASDDRGQSDTDDKTNDTAPSFNISNVEAHALIALLRDGIVVASTISNEGGNVVLSDPAVTVGIYDYSARQTDAAGNVSSVAFPLTVIIDNVAPAEPLEPDLQPASDTGLNTSDNNTSVTSPSFDIGNIEANATVELLRDGTVVASVTNAAAGSVTLTDPSAPNGTLIYKSRQTDVAGNSTTSSTGLSVTVDNGAPLAPDAPTLKASSDSGQSDSDGITNSTTLVFNVSGIVPGNAVDLLRNGLVIVTVNIAGADTISLTDPSGLVGDSVYTARQRNVAGTNSAASNPVNITLDTAAPDQPDLPDLQSASDSGISDADNITTSTTPVFDLGNIESGATVELLRDGVVVESTGNAVAGTVSLSDLTAIEGTFNYTVRQTDLAGNASSLSLPLSVTISLTAPPAPSAPTLQADSDLGNSDSDHLTSATVLTFNISGIPEGSSVDLLRNNVVVSTLDSATAGVNSLTDPSAPAGTLAYTVRQRNLAGLVSVASTPLTVVVETTPPAMPTQLDLQTASDLGTSNTDNMTKDPSPTFDIGSIEAGATVELLRGEIVVAILLNATPGLNSLTDPSAPPGTYNYTVQQIDTAGNFSSPSSPLSVTIQPNPSNRLPVAVADFYVVEKNQSLVVAGPGVLANDTDLDLDQLTALRGGPGNGGGGGGGTGAGPLHGILVLNPNGSFTYTPDTGYVGTDSFIYHVTDGYGKSNATTATITVYEDDHGNTPQTATFITFPSTTSGNLEVSGDADWFQFTKVPGTTYVLNVLPSSGAAGLKDFKITLFDIDGTTVLRTQSNGGGGVPAKIVFKPVANGSLYLKVEAVGASSGTYTLSAVVSAPPVVQTSVSPSLSSGGKVVVIDRGITVTDADSANFGGGSIVVKFNSGAGPTDTLKIAKQGTGAGQVNTSKNNVRIGKTIIGTFSGGAAGGALTINLNSSATPAMAQAVLRNITFSAKKKGLPVTTRVVSFVVTDDSALKSTEALQSVLVFAS